MCPPERVAPPPPRVAPVRTPRDASCALVGRGESARRCVRARARKSQEKGGWLKMLSILYLTLSAELELLGPQSGIKMGSPGSRATFTGSCESDPGPQFKMVRPQEFTASTFSADGWGEFAGNESTSLELTSVAITCAGRNVNEPCAVPTVDDPDHPPLFFCGFVGVVAEAIMGPYHATLKSSRVDNALVGWRVTLGCALPSPSEIARISGVGLGSIASLSVKAYHFVNRSTTLTFEAGATPVHFDGGVGADQLHVSLLPAPSPPTPPTPPAPPSPPLPAVPPALPPPAVPPPPPATSCKTAYGPSGVYEIVDGSGSWYAYCDMDTVDPYDGSVGGWTIVESYSRAKYAPTIKNKPFSTDATANAGLTGSSTDIDWTLYRMSKSHMQHIWSTATRVHGRCAQDFSHSTDDYFFATKEFVFGNTQAFDCVGACGGEISHGKYRGNTWDHNSGFDIHSGSSHDWHCSPPSGCAPRCGESFEPPSPPSLPCCSRPSTPAGARSCTAYHPAGRLLPPTIVELSRLEGLPTLPRAAQRVDGEGLRRSGRVPEQRRPAHFKRRRLGLGNGPSGPSLLHLRGPHHLRSQVTSTEDPRCRDRHSPKDLVRRAARRAAVGRARRVRCVRFRGRLAPGVVLSCYVSMSPPVLLVDHVCV